MPRVCQPRAHAEGEMPSILVQIVMSAAANTRRQLDGGRLILLRFSYRASPTTITGGGGAAESIGMCKRGKAATIVAASVRAPRDLSPLRSLFSRPARSLAVSRVLVFASLEGFIGNMNTIMIRDVYHE